MSELSMQLAFLARVLSAPGSRLSKCISRTPQQPPFSACTHSATCSKGTCVYHCQELELACSCTAVAATNPSSLFRKSDKHAQAAASMLASVGLHTGI